MVFGNPNGFGTNLELSDLDGTNGFVISGIDKSDSSGRSVSSAGDINGDGFDDLIIGGVLADNGDDQSVGESYVVFGKAGGFGANLELSSLDGSNGFVMIGIDAFDHSGTSVSSAGDVNGDGFDDLIIGSVGANPNGNFDAGESYVVFGKASGFAARLELSSLGAPNGFVINGIDADDDSGYSVSGAGDVNGDGFDDLIIGAKSADPGGINSGDGESYVVFGKAGSFGASLELSSLDGTNGFVINGINAFDRSGASVSSAGDVNGDGFDDLIIGASRADPNGNSSAGESYVIFGGNFTGGAETLVGDEADNLLAGSVGGDVLIGAQGDDTLAGGGGADVLRGGAGNDTLAVSDTDFRRLVGGNGLDTLRVDGSDIELDLTGDLRNRLTGIELIDLKGAGSNSLIIDKASVLNLSRESNMLTVLATADDSIEIGVGWTFDGLHSMGGILFSSYIQGAAKVMIGGRVHVADLAVGDGSVGSLATAISGGDFFAYAVSAAGDVNGDGFDDLIIGAPNADPGSAPEAGVTYVVFGRPDGFGTNMDISTLGGSNGFAIHGIDAYDISGLSVSGAGDVNGDGFDDIIIGAPQADFESNSLAGECYVVFGKADGFQATFQLSDLDGSSGFIIDDLGGTANC